MGDRLERPEWLEDAAPIDPPVWHGPTVPMPAKTRDELARMWPKPTRVAEWTIRNEPLDRDR